jgi:hypothetical protein
MTPLAAQLHRRMLPSVRLRGTIENATWPLRKAVWRVEEKVIWPLGDAVRSGRRDGYRVRRRWTPGLHRLRIRRLRSSAAPDIASAPEAIGGSEVVAPPETFAAAEAAAQPAAVDAADAISVPEPFPAPDRLGLLDRLDVRLALATVAVAASGGVGVAAIAGGFGGKHDESSPSTPAAATAPQIPASGGAPASRGRTLQGVTPEFEASSSTASKSDAASAASVSPLQGTNAKPSRIPAGSTNEAAALHTARDFAGAFVLYEIGKSNADVRKTFARTATPALVKALRDRPPRLPNSGKVPKARVQNVVLGVRRGRDVAASVSLLRLGALSELRLTLTRQHTTWAVSEVRG